MPARCSEAGYEVSIICPQGDTEDREPYALIDGIEIHRYPLKGAPEDGSVTCANTRRPSGTRGDSPAASGDFDVVHICNPPDLLFLRRAGRSSAAEPASIFDQHDLVPELYLSRFGRGKDSATTAACVALERMTYRVADVVIATNGSYRQRRARARREGARAVFVVRSAPDLSRFAGGGAEPALKRGKEHLLCYLGVMGPQDGVDYALRSLAALRDARPDDWHAVFVGRATASMRCARSRASSAWTTT